jgi:hypothetical protein
MLPYFLHFSPDLDEIWYRTYLEKCVLWKTLFTYRGRKYVIVVFHICYQISVCSVWRVLQSSSFDFREDQYREGRAFPTGLNGIHLRVRAVEQRYAASNERLGDICSASRLKQSLSVVMIFS